MSVFTRLGKSQNFHFGFEKVQRKLWFKLWRAYRMTKSASPSFRREGHIHLGKLYADLSVKRASLPLDAGYVLSFSWCEVFGTERQERITELTAKYRGANNEN